jgi:hypothetical protein
MFEKYSLRKKANFIYWERKNLARLAFPGSRIAVALLKHNIFIELA